MNSREIIKLNLALKDPPRIGFRFGENRLTILLFRILALQKNGLDLSGRTVISNTIPMNGETCGVKS